MYRQWALKLLVVVCWFGTASSAGTADPALSPTNIFAPASTPANTIFGLSIFVLAVTATIFVIVFSLLAYGSEAAHGRNAYASVQGLSQVVSITRQWGRDASTSVEP